jgi:hypothetical protein
MAIDHKDFMHGAALVAIADSQGFTALNKASSKYGHYIVNHDRHVFIKYNDGRGPGDYHFTYSAGDKERIRLVTGASEVFSVLVCGDEVIASIDLAILKQLIDLDSAESERITVRAETRKQLRYMSARADFGPIPRSSFPSCILE